MYLNDHIAFTTKRWGIDRPSIVTAVELPSWFVDAATPSGRGDLESHLGHSVPLALLELWAHPGLMNRLGQLLNYDFFGDPPFVFEWEGAPFLMFAADLGHAGGLIATKLDSGDNPAVGWGWDDVDSMGQLLGDSFTEWLDSALFSLTGLHVHAR